MATATRIPLSGAADGLGIKLAATATPGTIVHTAVNVAGQIDEIYLWAFNSDVSNLYLFVEYGEADTPIKLIVPLQTGLIPVLPGLPLRSGLVLRAYGQVTNKLKVFGYVNRVVN